eukprot:CAMPEP_0119004778 /NCGR_PEP_ID=MMETSP1176-20130426/1350_1 /TAXON_ID=265551 /ORGANISM="Synedropsis recta cf, Strain CCMP1620" /LENGTH=272 /DNA_ID=CAMNT_0006956523 /DNA_START=184 /DNA_END=999 /DNA_ORIENTATION=+
MRHQHQEQQEASRAASPFCQNKRYTMALLLSVSLFVPPLTAAFAPPLQPFGVARRTQHQRSPFLLLAQGNDFDDFSSSVGGDDNDDTSDGQALATAFYQQLRKREEQDEKEQQNQQPPPPSKQQLSEQEARFQNREAFSRRREVQVDKDGVTTELSAGQQKFTGRDSNSAGLFTGRGASVFSVPNNSNPAQQSTKNQMMQNELSLVGRAERTLLVQIVATLGLLCFALYIGWTGGIAANSADWANDIPNLDTSLEGMEGVLPVPTDTEASVW